MRSQKKYIFLIWARLEDDVLLRFVGRLFTLCVSRPCVCVCVWLLIGFLYMRCVFGVVGEFSGPSSSASSYEHEKEVCFFISESELYYNGTVLWCVVL